MKVIIAAIADHAWVEGGCLSICRTFDTIHAQKFPFQMRRLSIALRLLVGRSEIGTHKLSISLSDCDGQKLMNTDVNFNVQLASESIPETSFSFALNGQNIVFPKEGDYQVNMMVDSQMEASLPLYVRSRLPD
jgi:hypothetical protein